MQVLGSWNDWRAPGLVARQVEPGIWEAEARGLAPGRYLYKILVDGSHWRDDPANPCKAPDGFGGLNSVLTIPQNHRVEWRLA